MDNQRDPRGVGGSRNAARATRSSTRAPDQTHARPTKHTRARTNTGAPDQRPPGSTTTGTLAA
eukprot:7494274-Lingulodinium_polyedra.AAC.1